MNNQEYIDNQNHLTALQKALCERFGVEWHSSLPELKVGLSKNLLEPGFPMPLNGLRHLPEGDTSGWYIWSGEYSEDSNFFAPLHVSHIAKYVPAVLPYLGLPPCWRFQIDEKGYEDVWEDKTLLEV